MDSCLFCKIKDKKIPAKIVFENEAVMAFHDLYPQAKNHILFIHKSHSQDLIEMPLEQIQEIFGAIKECQKNLSINDGFRVVTNIGTNGGQSVFHTHFHLLWGEKLGGFGR
jgi:histidine triad (HIT) family protein